MNEYKYGDWYCKPANEAETIEVLRRAVAGGALLDEDVGDLRWDDCSAWGIIDGRTCTGGVDHAGQSFYGKTQYTIAELRQKFPLPGERMEPKKCNGEGLPPVGWHGECTWGAKATWHECVICPSGKVAHEYLGEWGVHDVSGHDFRPLRTEREKWIDSCLGVVPHNTSEADYLYMAADRIYGAIKSGALKAPEAE